jgi:hypothetical protein
VIITYNVKGQLNIPKHSESVLSLLKASDFFEEFKDSIYIDVKHALEY